MTSTNHSFIHSNIASADLFDVSDDDTKKMIIANLIKRVIVSKDYRIIIEYNSDVELLKQAA